MKIVVLASGRGSNFKTIADNIANGSLTGVEITGLISDKPTANALKLAKDYGVRAECVDAVSFADRDAYEKALVEVLLTMPCDLVVLAGYMKVLGHVFLDAVKVPVINIHPALLPSFPGLHAQRQAVEYGAKVSGCTVHFVDAQLDHGPIIAQVAVPVEEGDDEDSLSARILVQEHKLYTHCLQLLADDRVSIEDRRVIIR